MPSKDETRIVRAILKWVASQGGDGYHVHGSGMQRRGEPDIDCSVPRRDGSWLHIKCEVKTSGNKPSKQQAARLQDYANRGYLSFWVDSLEGFIDYVEANR